MKDQIRKILESKKLVINGYVIRISLEQKLSLNEFLVLICLDNDFSKSFDVGLISNTLGLDNNLIMEAFNNLLLKNIVSLETVKDLNGKISEEVSLNGLYNLILEDNISDSNKEVKDNVFKTFEKELGRTISSREIELINGWLETGTSEEMVLGALREALYNGIPRFTYIDKIIYEWDQKGFKNMEDVHNHMKNNRVDKDKDDIIKKKENDILDYDWINDDN